MYRKTGRQILEDSVIGIGNEKYHSDMRCSICGIRAATTHDHVPPKSIFPRPRLNDLVTVPACQECNMGASGFDEKFRVYLSLHVGLDTPDATRLWTQHAVKTFRHNNRLRREILGKSQRVDMVTKAGIIIGEGYRFEWDSAAHDTTVDRTIRGLYFHHFGDSLGEKVRVQVHWHQNLTKEIIELSSEWSMNSMGNDIFVYRFSRAVDQPLASIWLLQFYGRHWASGSTFPNS